MLRTGVLSTLLAGAVTSAIVAGPLATGHRSESFAAGMAAPAMHISAGHSTTTTSPGPKGLPGGPAAQPTPTTSGSRPSAAPTSPPPPAAPPTRAGLVSTSHGVLMFDGSRYIFTGLDAYEAATQRGTNYGCGGALSDANLDSLFSSLPANSMFRIWAFQGSMAIDVHSGRLNFAPLDRVIAAARAHHQEVTLSLTDQAGTCDDNHWKGPDWYAAGFNTVAADASTGRAVMSYTAYMKAIVTHFRGDTTVAMWEPVNEPEASTCATGYHGSGCGGHTNCADERVAAADMRSFFDRIGGLIHRLDPGHLVESGTMGGGQCGTGGDDYALVHASSGLDVLSYHDYSPGSLPGDQWNGLVVRMKQATALGKPLIVGEVGVEAGSSAACTSLASRAGQIRDKLRAQLALGVSGIMAWDWVPKTASCDYDIAPGDPTLSVLSNR